MVLKRVSTVLLTFLFSCTMLLAMMTTVSWADDDKYYVETDSFTNNGKYIIAVGDDTSLVAMGKEWSHLDASAATGNKKIERLSTVEGLTVQSYGDTKYIQTSSNEAVWTCTQSGTNYYLNNGNSTGNRNFYICSEGIKYHNDLRPVLIEKETGTGNRYLYSNTSSSSYAVTYIESDSYFNNESRFGSVQRANSAKGTPVRIFELTDTPPGPAKYKVTYDGNGATSGADTIPADATEYTDESNSVTVLGAGSMARTGYSFDCWKDETANKFYVADDTFTIAANTTLKAQWTPNTYKVKFEKGAEDATGEMADQDFSYDEEKALSENTFAREGWIFAGWKAGDKTYSDKDKVKNLTADANAAVTLTAQWEKPTAFSVVDKGSALRADTLYIIAARDDNGDLYALDKTALNGGNNNTVSAVKITLKDGMLYTNDSNIQLLAKVSGSNTFLTGKSATTTVTADMFYTSSSGLKYQGSWTGTSGTGYTGAPRTINYDSDGYLVGDEPTPTASPKYVTFNKTNHTFGAQTGSTGAAEIVLFAEFTYKVSFDLNGHGPSAGIADVSVKPGSKVSAPTDPMDDDYTFKYWYTKDESENETQYDFDTEVTEDLTLYAKWGKKPVTVTFDAQNGEETHQTNVVTAEGKLDMAALPTPDNGTQTDKVFEGWYDAADASGNRITLDTVFDVSTTVYAKWVTKVQYAENLVKELPAEIKIEDIEAASADIEAARAAFIAAYEGVGNAEEDPAYEFTNAKLEAAEAKLEAAKAKAELAEKEELISNAEELKAAAELAEARSALAKDVIAALGKSVKAADYTKASYDAYTKALEDAMAALDNAEAGKDALIAAKTALEEAKLVKKAANKMTVKAAKVKFKVKTLQKKAQSAKAVFTVTDAAGKVTYKKKTGDKKITVSSSGVIKAKKGLKKGRYIVYVNVTDAGNNNVKSLTKKVKVTVTVK